MNAINSLINALATRCQTLSWTLMRVLSSTMFMTHGFAKLFGERAQPVMGGMDFFGIDLGINMLWVAAVIELFGGALLVLGLWTRIAAFFAAVLMVMAYLTAHRAWFPTLNNGELAAMYFLVYFVLFAKGAGPISVDSRMQGGSR